MNNNQGIGGTRLRKCRQYAKNLIEKGELPPKEEVDSRLNKEIYAFYDGIMGGGNVLVALLTHSGDVALQIQDYFYNGDGKILESRRVKDIADAIGEKHSTVNKAVDRLESIALYRPNKGSGNGRLVAPYKPIFEHVYDRRDKGLEAHNVTKSSDFIAMQIGALRNEFSGSDWAMTHGIELTYLPELVKTAPPGTDVRVDWDVTKRGFAEVILKADPEMSDEKWEQLLDAVRIQTRGIITRMLYDPDTKTVTGSHKLPNRVVERIKQPHSAYTTTCDSTLCAHFKVNIGLAIAAVRCV